MSKLSKLVKHPVLFFKDAAKKRSKVVIKPKSTKKAPAKKAPAKKAPATNPLLTINLHSNIILDDYEIGIYFSDKVESIYQLEQWIVVFEKLKDEKNIVIITREDSAFKWISKNTQFTTVYCRTLQNLQKFYEDNNLKCILYVNHGFKNFQSMINNKAYHIHINHGESDKTSTITRQSQAYDYMFVYGEESIRKYKSNLINCDLNKYIKIGRPQLEHVDFMTHIDTDRKIILYAPTWEGTHDSMNFSSIDDFGLKIVNSILEDDKYFLIYKPHPKLGIRDKITKSIHNEIVKLLNENANAKVMLNGDIISLYKNVDLGIYDNSVVLIDYLPFDKPIIITNMFKESAMITKPLLAESGILLQNENINNIINIIDNELTIDSTKSKREYVKKEFLGEFDYSNGESTKTFINELDKLCLNRDEALIKLQNG